MSQSTAAAPSTVEQSGGKLELPELPAGYHFSPNDEEAMVYVKCRILNQPAPSDVIPSVDIYQYGDPHRLPLKEFKHGPGDEWCFYGTRLKEIPLITASGRWEEIGDYEIEDGDEVVGFMKRLAFHYANPEEDAKTDWYIDEYRANPATFAADELANATVREKISNLVVCKVSCEDKAPSRPQIVSSSSEDLEEVPDTRADDEQKDNEVGEKKNP